MAVCRKCEGRKVLNGKTCDNCNGTGFQDGRNPVPAADRKPKVSTTQWTKAIRTQMAPKKSK
jgi:hypothetical protein